MTELQLLAWLGFFVYLSRRRGNTVHYYHSEQLAAVHIKRQRKPCLMTKTDSRLQIWTSWCIPASNMKDRKYLTCASFGKQEKIWRSSMALLRLLINLFLIVGFCPFSFLSPLCSGKMKQPCRSCSALVSDCEKDGPISTAQRRRSSPSTSRGGLGSDLEHCTSGTWPGQWSCPSLISRYNPTGCCRHGWL